MEKKKYLHSEAREMDSKDPVVHAIATLVLHARMGGVREDGETATIMVPSFEYGPDPKKMEPTGEYEIIIKKIGDD